MLPVKAGGTGVVLLLILAVQHGDESLSLCVQNKRMDHGRQYHSLIGAEHRGTDIVAENESGISRVFGRNVRPGKGKLPRKLHGAEALCPFALHAHAAFFPVSRIVNRINSGRKDFVKLYGVPGLKAKNAAAISKRTARSQRAFFFITPCIFPEPLGQRRCNFPG